MSVRHREKLLFTPAREWTSSPAGVRISRGRPWCSIDPRPSTDFCLPFSPDIHIQSGPPCRCRLQVGSSSRQADRDGSRNVHRQMHDISFMRQVARVGNVRIEQASTSFAARSARCLGHQLLSSWRRDSARRHPPPAAGARRAMSDPQSGHRPRLARPSRKEVAPFLARAANQCCHAMPAVGS